MNVNNRIRDEEEAILIKHEQKQFYAGGLQKTKQEQVVASLSLLMIWQV